VDPLKHKDKLLPWGNVQVPRRVDVRLPGKGNLNSHGARPVHLIITMIKWIRTSRLSIKKQHPVKAQLPPWGDVQTPPASVSP